MLTKDLLRFRRSGERISPRFASADDPASLDLAEKLLEVFAAETKPTVSELDALTAPLLQGVRDLKLAKGLLKTLKDRCEFSLPDANVDYAAVRARAFAASAAALRDPNIVDFAAYEAKTRELLTESGGLPEGDLFADLPENERLLSVRSLAPRQLIERYNLALVQSLLLYAEGLDLTVRDPRPARARKLFKYLKFFRLLAAVKRLPARSGGETPRFRARVDGPMSLFDNTRKYGLALASFFPAVCDLSEWEIEATVKIGERENLLKLDQRSGLTGVYRHFSAYVPEEFAMFQKLFAEKSEIWRSTDSAAFLDLGDQEVVFPDFSFTRGDGLTLHLELFHRWHAGPLIKRLERLESNPNLPLIIGVDNFLARKPEIADILAKSAYFAAYGFSFRDFPGVEKTSRRLDRKADSMAVK